jgi:hypothetical protein
MAFGQPSGPPASAKQVRELLELLQQAGHTDFRDARGPMGFTQRQAAGKFTRDEADEFIAQLESEQQTGPGPEPTASRDEPTPARRPPPARADADARALRRYSTEQLAAELQRRGWVVMDPG